MKLSVDDFDTFHVAVHRTPPFAWQNRLLRQILQERAWPRVLDVPTGAGKTTCIDIAVFALALDAQNRATRWCPRRIAMVVDRRVVVDQAAERGRKLLSILANDDGNAVVKQVAQNLRSLSSNATEPVGVFTLRGGMPKDDGWARTPDQPLILASTVDHIGSRLLIQGYGVSRGMKPIHAGLLGSDVLLLLDEVHLSQPFAQTLDALERLRRRFETSSPLSPRCPRFYHTFLSATPGASDATPFRLNDDEKSSDSALRLRLHATKPVRLIEVADRSALENKCVDEARVLVNRHDVVAVVVNRVATASTVVARLRDALGSAIDVQLLTGRMRPLDRDDVLAALRPRIVAGHDRGIQAKKLIVVGTQCIEAGADFDFDALVTEAASIDSLRQRFGRVDRLGLYGRAEGVVVGDKSAKDDPVYGEAIPKTISWLKGKVRNGTKDIDFGVLALPLPPAEGLRDLLAPKAHAPALLPAYLDLWMQTFPPPVVAPDVSLWLHGSKSGPADVQVVWRADLTEDDLDGAVKPEPDERARDLPATIVAAVRPSSLEAMPLPFVAARRWLSGYDDVAEFADVEGGGGSEGDGRLTGLVVRWHGDDSEVISVGDLLPGDTIVVPHTRGGIRDGCFDPRSTAPVADLAERAALFARGQPVLRLHEKVLAQLGLSVPIDDLQQARGALEVLAGEADQRSWRHLWLDRLARSKGSIVVDANQPWAVLQGRRVAPRKLRAALLHLEDSVEDGVELTTDEDDSFHAGEPTPLSEHSTDVERLARVYAVALDLPTELAEDLALAAWLHDIGKADRRFQVLLRGGSQIAFFKDETPWAKSRLPPGAKAAHRLAQRNSGYPQGARHELQSVRMIEKHFDVLEAKAHDADLVLHLIASHHGYCRPLAPIVVDHEPVDVMLSNHESAAFGKLDFAVTSSAHELYRLDSPLADRFWRLVTKYGWQDLCWLEAIFRLADHRASELEEGVSDEA